MRNQWKKGVSILLCGLLCLPLCGCQLALPDSDIAATQGDRLIGVFVTEEPLDLFDFEAYLNDNLNTLAQNGDTTLTDTETQRYNGRIYATKTTETLHSEDGSLVEMETFAFEGVQGSALYCYTMVNENGEEYSTSTVTGQMQDVKIATGNDTKLEGTILLNAMATATPLSYYANPVYQTVQGDVYLTAGQGMSFSGDYAMGMSGTSSLTEEQTITRNGETTTTSFSVSITAEMALPATQITLLEMSAEDEVIKQHQFTPETLPEELTPQAGTAYAIAKITSAGNAINPQQQSYQLMQKGGNPLVVALAGQGTICESKNLTLLWAE